MNEFYLSWNHRKIGSFDTIKRRRLKHRRIAKIVKSDPDDVMMGASSSSSLRKRFYLSDLGPIRDEETGVRCGSSRSRRRISFFLHSDEFPHFDSNSCLLLPFNHAVSVLYVAWLDRRGSSLRFFMLFPLTSQSECWFHPFLCLNQGEM